jgi:hypothetical protein
MLNRTLIEKAVKLASENPKYRERLHAILKMEKVASFDKITQHCVNINQELHTILNGVRSNNYSNIVVGLINSLTQLEYILAILGRSPPETEENPAVFITGHQELNGLVYKLRFLSGWRRVKKEWS